jgi:hypothetical protein
MTRRCSHISSPDRVVGFNVIVQSLKGSRAGCREAIRRPIRRSPRRLTRGEGL